MSQYKNPLVIANILFLIVSVAAGIYYININQNQDVRSKAANVPTLSLKTDSQTVQLGNRLGVIVAADSTTEAINLIKTNLTYNPQHLRVIDITPGDYFTNTQINENYIDPNSGTIYYCIEADTGSPPNAGAGTIAIIVFETIKPGVTDIQFRPDSQLQSTIGGANILQERVPLKIAIQPGPSNQTPSQ